jgi:hypothetical protein
MSRLNAGWAVVAVLLAACGGATFTDTDGGPGDGSDGGTSGGDGGRSDGGAVIACPSTPPTPGAACPVSCPPQGAPCLALQCEYGTSPIMECNQLFNCDGTWSADTRGGDPKICSPSTAGCPATRASVPVGTACTPSGLECDYPDGRCACTISQFGPVRMDAGSEWICTSPQMGCPAARPLVGSACTTPGELCDYGGCELQGGVTLTCSSGRWQSTPTPCPG